MDGMTGAREAQLIEAANLFLDARRTMSPFDDLPEDLRPTTSAEAEFVQDRVAEGFGPVGGWKIGAASLEATPAAAPMPRIWMGPTGSCLSGKSHRFRGLEAEIAFLLGKDLPVRATPYTHDEVYAAVASCHPIIEVLESGLTNPVDPAVRLSKDADLQMNGGFIFGPAYPDWKSVDLSKEHVTLTVDGVVRVEATGSNTSGNLLRLLPWLANEGSARTGGLTAGQWVTTGSWTGYTPAMAGSTVDARFSTMGVVGLRFE